MNKLQHNVLHEMQGNEFKLDDMCHLGNDLGTWFGAFCSWNFSKMVLWTFEKWTGPTTTHQVGN